MPRGSRCSGHSRAISASFPPRVSRCASRSIASPSAIRTCPATWWSRTAAWQEHSQSAAAARKGRSRSHRRRKGRGSRATSSCAMPVSAAIRRSPCGWRISAPAAYWARHPPSMPPSMRRASHAASCSSAGSRQKGAWKTVRASSRRSWPDGAAAASSCARRAKYRATVSRSPRGAAMPVRRSRCRGRSSCCAMKAAGRCSAVRSISRAARSRPKGGSAAPAKPASGWSTCRWA